MADLDPAKWKDVVTSRGAKYHYYYSPAQGDKVTFQFVHGYPSLGRDWRQLALPLQAKGYGILIPDMYGYGGTDKPSDPALYRLKLLCQDLVDLLDAEKVQKVIAVGHDWGSFVVSRLVNYFPDRYVAFAFLSVPYSAPSPETKFEDIVAFMTSQLGYDPYGYWHFFNEDDAHKVYAEHHESAVAIAYAKDQSTLFRDIVCPRDALKQALLRDYIPPGGLASYMSDEDIKIFSETFKKDTFQGPLCYYKCQMRDFNKADELAIPEERRIPPVSTPIFFGVGKRDVICTPQIGRIVLSNERYKNNNIVINEFEGDHWLTISDAKELAQGLDEWASSAVVPGIKASM